MDAGASICSSRGSAATPARGTRAPWRRLPSSRRSAPRAREVSHRMARHVELAQRAPAPGPGRDPRGGSPPTAVRRSRPLRSARAAPQARRRTRASRRSSSPRGDRRSRDWRPTPHPTRRAAARRRRRRSPLRRSLSDRRVRRSRPAGRSPCGPGSVPSGAHRAGHLLRPRAAPPARGASAGAVPVIIS